MGVIDMSMYRRFARSKKGMSTVFGGLFFVILILMAFNVMLWSFVQYNAYNNVVTAAGIRNQQAMSENLVFNAPGASGFSGNNFNLTVSNQGGVAVTLARIYVTNLSPTNSAQCQGAALCTINPPPSSMYFTGGNIAEGQLNHVVTVHGITINDGSGYQVVLSTTRGRQFSFYYPWPVNTYTASNSNSTNTDHGALDVQFQFNSFNFTDNNQVVSTPAWTVPYGTNVVYWVKVVNNALSPITISQYSSLYFICYQDRFGSGQGQCTETDDDFVVDSSTLNPNNLVAYDQATNPYVLPAAGPNGPNGYTIMKFGSACPGDEHEGGYNSQCTSGGPLTPQDVDYPTPYLVFMGFFYQENGYTVGQTISFVAIRACATYPSCP
jgi:hypothetical protein